jgi:hypothetical protein
MKRSLIVFALVFSGSACTVRQGEDSRSAPKADKALGPESPEYQAALRLAQESERLNRGDLKPEDVALSFVTGCSKGEKVDQYVYPGVVCPKDLPTDWLSVEVDTEIATATVVVNKGGKKHEVIVNMENINGKWKVNTSP